MDEAGQSSTQLICKTAALSSQQLGDTVAVDGALIAIDLSPSMADASSIEASMSAPAALGAAQPLPVSPLQVELSKCGG